MDEPKNRNPAPQVRIFSIASRISLTLFLLTGLSILIVYRILISLSLQLQVEQLNSTLAAHNQIIATQISTYLHGNLLDKLSYLTKVRGILQLPPEIRTNLLEGLLQQDDNFEMIAVLDHTGSLAASVSSTPLSPQGKLPEAALLWESFTHQENYIGPITLDSDSGKAFITIAVPFPDPQEQRNALLSATVNLNFLCPIICQAKVEDQGYFYVIDDHYYLTMNAEKPETITIKTLVAHPFIKDLPFSLGAVIEHLPATSFFPVYTGLHGNNVFRMKTPMVNLNWQVVAELPADNPYKPFSNILLITGLVLGLALMVSLGVGYFISRRIVLSLQQLNQIAAEINTGNLEVEIDIYQRDEVGVLASTFRQMLIRLRQSVSELKQQILQREQAEAALKTSEEKYKTLFENAPVAIFVAQDDRIKFINPKTEQLFGYSKEELTSNVFTNFIHKEDQALVLERHRRRIQKEDIPSSYSYRVVGKTGEIKWIELRAVLFTWENKPATLCFLTDITEQRELETQLHQSHKMEALGTLAGGIAHDFNNMLAVILNNAEMGLTKFPENSKARDYLENILTAGTRAESLIKQILTFSRMEIAHFNPVNLSSVVQGALKMVEATLPAQIEIRQDLLKDYPNIMADATQIQQIILNLCTNAYHAMEETGGVLEVRIEKMLKGFSFSNTRDEPYLRLSIKDTGQGISSKDQARVFDPFFTTKGVGKGTGLGLSVVHGIVEKHQGKISIQSEIGKGTTVSIDFLITEEVADESITESQIENASGHILVVEDELLINNAYKAFLEDEGYQVTACSNGSEALAIFKEIPWKFDLVLTDQSMPHMTGKQLAQELLIIRPDLPVILSSGYNESISDEEALALGIRQYVFKPIPLETLHQIIVKWISPGK